MAEIKYSISVLKKDPLVKIKVTGVYNQKYQHFYYQNPITCRWCRVVDDYIGDDTKINSNTHFDLFKKVTYQVKKLADMFYEDSKDLFEAFRKSIKDDIHW